MSLDQVLYTATATATGGRDGRAVSSDNLLDIPLSTPRELGGAGGRGTNPVCVGSQVVAQAPRGPQIHYLFFKLLVQGSLLNDSLNRLIG